MAEPEPEYTRLAAVLAEELHAGADPMELFDRVIVPILEELGLVAAGGSYLTVFDEVEAAASPPLVRETVQRWRERLVLLLGAVGRES